MHKNITLFSLALFIPQMQFASQSPQITDICRQPQLLLHFDINKTIIAMDAVQGKDLDTTINGILAEFTFEKWDGKHKQSYYAYETDQIAQEYPQMSKADETFKSIRSERLKEFPAYLKKLPKLLATYQADKTAMLKILSNREMVIFPSFYKTIRWLNDHFATKYAIYLRTFGQDLPDVVATIEKNTTLKFACRGAFQGSKLSLQGTNPSMRIPIRALWDFITSHPIHSAIQDDYSYWKAQGFQAAGGKPFPIDLNNPRVIAIFFDDNADDPVKPIIHPIGPHEKLEDTKELLKRGNIVAVNPKQAIVDEDYFINKIKALLPQK